MSLSLNKMPLFLANKNFIKVLTIVTVVCFPIIIHNSRKNFAVDSGNNAFAVWGSVWSKVKPILGLVRYFSKNSQLNLMLFIVPYIIGGFKKIFGVDFRNKANTIFNQSKANRRFYKILTADIFIYLWWSIFKVKFQKSSIADFEVKANKHVDPIWSKLTFYGVWNVFFEKRLHFIFNTFVII